MKRFFVSSFAILVLVLITPFANASQQGLAHITLIKGDILLFDDETNDWVRAAVNTPLEEGDRLWSGNGSRAEISFKNGSNLRIADKTALDFVRLDDNEQQVYLGSGRLYIITSEIGDDFQIDTEDAEIDIGKRSKVHIDLVGRKEVDTEVSVMKGNAYVESISGKTRVRSGESLLFSENGAELAPLNKPGTWERWNEKRDKKLSNRNSAQHYLPEELVVYEDELSSNGKWVLVEGYGYAWRPSVAIDIDWAPYRNGRWVWRRGNYVWIGLETWGWAPFHYGRWHHHPSLNWVWIPPRTGDIYWSPGYVAWVDTQYDLAWVPLAPGEIYYGRGYYGNSSINITNINQRTIVKQTNIYKNSTVRNAITYIKKDQFASGRGKPQKLKSQTIQHSGNVIAPPYIRPTSREARVPDVKKIQETRLPPEVKKLHPAGSLKERFPKHERGRGPIDLEKPPKMPKTESVDSSKPLTTKPLSNSLGKNLERNKQDQIKPQIKTQTQSSGTTSKSFTRTSETEKGSNNHRERQPNINKQGKQIQQRENAGNARKIWQIAPRENHKDNSAQIKHNRVEPKKQKHGQERQNKDN